MNSSLANSLRQMADFVEAFPKKIGYVSPIFYFAESKEEMVGLLTGLGPWEKVELSDWFNMVRNFGSGVEFRLSIARPKVCERVKVGERVIPARPETVLPAEDERVEDVYEWRCPESILKG